MTREEFSQLPAPVQDEVTQDPDCPIDFKREYLGEFDDFDDDTIKNTVTLANGDGTFERPLAYC